MHTPTTKAIAAVPVVVFLFAWTLTTHGKYSVSGDEPHYLMIAESLRTDFDLNVANNYAQNDGRLFGHDNLPMELHAIRSRTGEVRSIHGIGLPVALLPVYALARQVAVRTPEALLERFRMDRGLFTYSIVSLFLIAVTSFGLILLAAGLGTITPRFAPAIAIAVGISPPVVSHAFLVFPEVLALFVTCCVVWFAMKRPSANDGWVLPIFLVLMGMLPWLHHKYFIYTAGLIAVLVWRRWPLLHGLERGRKAIGFALFLAPQLALLGWSLHEWGTFAGPIATGALTAEAAPFSSAGFKNGLIGLWFDRQSGLLAYAPLYWIVPACWWLAWRRTWAYGVPAVLLYLPAAAFLIGWWAGFAPAARYLVPAVPLLTVPVAYTLSHRSIRIAAVIVMLMQVPINAVIWQNPRWLWPGDEGNPALQALGHIGGAYESLLPGVRTDGLTVHALVALSAAGLVTTVIVVAARRKRPASPAAAA